MNKRTIPATQLAPQQLASAQKFAENHDKLDLLTHKFSYSPNSEATSLVDEHATAQQFGITITNTMDTNQTIGIVPFIKKDGSIDLNPTIFSNAADILAAMSVQALLNDGVIAGADAKALTVGVTDPSTSVAKLLRHLAKNPTHIVKISMKSQTVGGVDESSNFDGVISTFFFSPFADPKKRDLKLRPLQKNTAFQKNLMDVDFLAERFQVVLSDETFARFTVNAGTRLTIDFFIGAFHSIGQEFYRDMKQASQIIAPEVIKNQR